MAYSDFDITRVQAELGVTISTRRLFTGVPPVTVSPHLHALLPDNHPLAVAVSTEKARSEFLISPLLSEVWRRGQDRVALFSGVPLNADPAAGLVGVCDFILGLPPQLDFVTAPLMVVVEAKREDVMGGLGQCAAAMVGAQRFNRTRNPAIDTIYGCVTNGVDWKFLSLRGTDLVIDADSYLINEPDRILGLLVHCVGLSPAAPVAA